MGVRFRKKEEPDKSILYQKSGTLKKRSKNYFSGKVPNLLIGSYGYPDVSTGALVDDIGGSVDDPKDIVAKRHDIDRVLQSRQSLVNSRVMTNVKTMNSRFTEQAGDLAKSKRSVDSEVFLKKAVTPGMSFDERNMPHGPSGELRKLMLTSNPHIPRPIERLTSDTDVKATTALHELNSKGFDEHYLTKLFSVGTLGQKRKLVPTKWSITAVDDTISDRFRDEVLDYQEKDYRVYTGEYMGNEYVILFLPGPWSFELFEMAVPHCIYNSTDEVTITQDYEFQQGRKKYASNTSGAYYAAKLAALEKCRQEKMQARVIVFRVITKRYTVPLGVWVVREGVRMALEKADDAGVSSTAEAKRHAQKLITPKIGEDASELLKASKLFSISQKSLSSWM
ncbi:MAG: hypothetical protein ACLFSN_04440 [Candidatus Woesearchaeota archaeon]